MQGKVIYGKLLALLEQVLCSTDFMKRQGASIMGELSYEIRQFFQQLITGDDFEAAALSNRPAPAATCNINTHCILTLDGGPAGNLTDSLRPPASSDQNRTPGGGGSTESNNSNWDRGASNGHSTNSTRPKDYRPNKAWAPAFKTFLGTYTAKDGEKLKLGDICCECRKSVE